MPSSASEWVRVALNLFKISFLFILARCAKMNRKLILKSPRFVRFGTKLARLEDKSEIPDTERLASASPVGNLVITLPLTIMRISPPMIDGD